MGLLDYACTFGRASPATGTISGSSWTSRHQPLPVQQGHLQHGAHNQRSIVAVRVWFAKFFWIEDLIALVEESACCDLYALLKRPDEKYVTERAYARPALRRGPGPRGGYPPAGRRELHALGGRGRELRVQIHAHSAYARSPDRGNILDRIGFQVTLASTC